MNLKIDEHFILDRTETWPIEFTSLLKENSELIKNYFFEEKRIDELKFPKNELNGYKFNFQKLVHQLEQILLVHKLIGIHCTRLLDEEIENLKEEGLKPLTQELAISKINTAYSKGIITNHLKNELLNKEEYQLECRTDMAYFFHCLSTLKQESDLNKLFGYWGGEAIYMYNKDSTELKKIGTPCIVLLSINVSELNPVYPLSERMIEGHFENNLDSQDSDSIMNKPVKVLDIIKYPNDLFEELTNYSKWEEANMNF